MASKGKTKNEIDAQLGGAKFPSLPLSLAAYFQGRAAAALT